jgi:hypothetical protein
LCITYRITRHALRQPLGVGELVTSLSTAAGSLNLGAIRRTRPTNAVDIFTLRLPDPSPLLDHIMVKKRRGAWPEAARDQ